MYKRQAIQFLLEQAANFRPGSVVTDICGVKQAVVSAVEAPLLARGIAYLGSHPMAGRECSGFDAAKEELFLGASWILKMCIRDRYLPLITTNCAVLGIAILNVDNGYTFAESLVNSFGTGVGFLLAMVLFAGVRSRIEGCDVPECFKGTPITLIAASLMAVAFMGFSLSLIHI